MGIDNLDYKVSFRISSFFDHFLIQKLQLRTVKNKIKCLRFLCF